MVGFVVGGCFANKQNPAGFHLSFKLSLRVLKIVKTNRQNRIYSWQSQILQAGLFGYTKKTLSNCNYHPVYQFIPVSGNTDFRAELLKSDKNNTREVSPKGWELKPF